VTGQLAPLFQAVRDLLGPLSSSTKDIAAAFDGLNAQFEDLAGTTGNAAQSLTGPLAAQLLGALTALNDALIANAPALAESLAQIRELAETVAAFLTSGADQIKGLIDGQDAQLRSLGTQLAPVLSQACALRGPLTLVSNFVAFGYAFDGLFVPFEEACGGPESESAFPLNFDDLATDLGLLAQEIFVTAEPFGGVLRPVAEPTCVAISPLLVVSVLGASALPVPFPIGGALAPLSVVCAFGQGPDALQGLVVLSARASEPFVPALDEATKTIAALTPLTDLISPLTDPLLAPVCEAGPLGELVTALAIPLAIPVQPLAIVNEGLVPFCGKPEARSDTDEPPGDTSDDAGAPPPIEGTVIPPTTQTFEVDVPLPGTEIGDALALGPPPGGVAGTVGVITRATWLLIAATVLAALALASLLIPRKRAIAALLRITR
jgi:hypothetical protein